MAKKILVVLTSFGELNKDGKTKPTGWYLPELAHPYYTFKEAGYEITTVSPAGGVAPLDPASVEAFKSDKESVDFLENHKDVWEKTGKISDVVASAASEYDALFYPGGHGPMFDLVSDEDSKKLAAAFFDAGKPVAAVCHGTIALADVVRPSGAKLLQGKTVTGFSDREEDMAQMTQDMPFSLEAKVAAAGGTYVKAPEPWAEKVVVDGNVVTGQNPASAKGVGEEIVKLLK